MPNPVTSISAQTTIKGDLRLDGPAVIAGRIQGSIVANDTLELTAEGTIEGNIEVPTLTIRGTVKGNIVASKACRIGHTGRVAGNICVPNLAIAEGARYVGHVCVGQNVPPGPAGEEVPAIRAVEESMAQVEQVAAQLETAAPPVTPPAEVPAAAPAPTVQIMTENVQAALHRGPRIIKAR